MFQFVNIPQFESKFFQIYINSLIGNLKINFTQKNQELLIAINEDYC